MTIRFDNYNADEFISALPLIFAALVALLIVIAIANYCIQKSDNNKPPITKHITILQKLLSRGNIEWYLVEFENGERLKLRSFQAQTLLISENDTGIVTYKGITIQSFERDLSIR